MSDDWEYDDYACPKCGAYPTRCMRCPEIGCDDGYVDMHEFDDPMLFDEGDYERCQSCKGTGRLRWCGKCGYDLTIQDLREQESEPTPSRDGAPGAYEKGFTLNKVDLLFDAFQPPEIDIAPEPLANGVCAISGKSIASGIPIAAIVTSATNQPHETFKVPHTQHVSIEAARLFKCMKAGGMTGNLLATPDGGYKPMVSRESAVKAGRACWHDLILSIASGTPAVAIFSTDTKRRFWPFTYLSVVGEAWTVYLHDDSISQNITVSISRLRECLTLLEFVYNEGFSKYAMRESLYEYHTWKESNLPIELITSLEEQLAQWRGTPEFQLAIFIVQRSNETQETE